MRNFRPTGSDDNQEERSLSIPRTVGNRKFYKALVANDDPFQLRMIDRILAQTGQFVIEEAENGLIAFDRARQKPYDVIILDLDMPIMSGFEACQKIRAFEEGGGQDITDLLHIDKNFSNDDSQNVSLFLGPNNDQLSKFQPLIIALSALITEEIFVKCLDSGFDDVSKFIIYHFL